MSHKTWNFNLSLCGWLAFYSVKNVFCYNGTVGTSSPKAKTAFDMISRHIPITQTHPLLRHDLFRLIFSWVPVRCSSHSGVGRNWVHSSQFPAFHSSFGTVPELSSTLRTSRLELNFSSIMTAKVSVPSQHCFLCQEHPHWFNLMLLTLCLKAFQSLLGSSFPLLNMYEYVLNIWRMYNQVWNNVVLTKPWAG